MLAYLRGAIQAKELTGGTLDLVVLEVAGVGFEVNVSHRTFLSLGQLGDSVTLHTALSIRETDWTIFGFATIDERAMFNLVQSVSGIGPKLAMALVGTLSPEDLAEAIIAEDHKLISVTPGVGPKVAQRLILELKAKVEDWKLKRGLAPAASSAAGNNSFEEVRDILQGLGYTPTEINMALKQIEKDKVDQDVELLVRHTLKVLGAVAN
jgi:Holliday junction DNA helicase RuvA